jgi:hypothetical protein
MRSSPKLVLCDRASVWNLDKPNKNKKLVKQIQRNAGEEERQFYQPTNDGSIEHRRCPFSRRCRMIKRCQGLQKQQNLAQWDASIELFTKSLLRKPTYSWTSTIQCAEDWGSPDTWRYKSGCCRIHDLSNDESICKARTGEIKVNERQGRVEKLTWFLKNKRYGGLGPKIKKCKNVSDPRGRSPCINSISRLFPFWPIGSLLLQKLILSRSSVHPFDDGKSPR